MKKGLMGMVLALQFCSVLLADHCFIYWTSDATHSNIAFQDTEKSAFVGAQDDKKPTLLKGSDFENPVIRSQKLSRVFVGEISGPDPFISERFRMLFLEKLSALKSIELVDSKETAGCIIEGIGRVENLVDIQENGKTTATAGKTSHALLSVKLIDAASKRILLVVNENAKSDKRPAQDLVTRVFANKEATQAVVEKAVDQICKKMKWK